MPDFEDLVNTGDKKGAWESFTTGFSAGLKETSVAGLYRLLTRPSFEPVEGYDPIDDAEQRYPRLFRTYMQSFASSVSPQETDYIAQRLMEHEQNMMALSASGGWGTAGLFAGGFIDPIALLPYFGAAKNIYGVKRATDLLKATTSFAVQTGAAAAASTALGGIDRPEFRPERDLPNSFLAGAAVGLVLGGGVGAIKYGAVKLNETAAKRAVEKLAKAVDEIDSGGAHKEAFARKLEEGLSPEQASREAYTEVLKQRAANEETMPVYAKTPDEAVEKTPDPVEVSRQGLLKGPLGDAFMWLDAKVNPVVAVAESDFETARKIQALISDAGLVWKATADGKVVAPMNTIENRVHGYHYGIQAEILDTLNNAYTKWLMNKNNRAFNTEVADISSSVLGVIGKKDLTKQTFSQIAFKEYALGKGYSSPETQMVGQKLQQVFDRMFAEAESVGLVDRKQYLGVNKYGEPYIPFNIDSDKVVTHSNEFLDDVTPFVYDEIKTKLSKFTDKQKAKLRRLTQLQDDLSAEDLVKKADEIVDEIETKRQETFSKINERYPIFQELIGSPITENQIRAFDEYTERHFKKILKRKAVEMRALRVQNEADLYELFDVNAWVREQLDKIRDTIEHIKTKDPDYLAFKQFKAAQNKRLRDLSKVIKRPAVKTAKAAEKVEKGLDRDKAARHMYRFASRVRKLIDIKEQKIKDRKLVELSIKRAIDTASKYFDLVSKAADGVSKRELGRREYVLKTALENLDKRLRQRADLNEFFASKEWKKIEENIDELLQEATDRVLRIGEEYGRQLGKLEGAQRKAPASVLKKIEEEIKEIDEFLAEMPVEVVAPFLKGANDDTLRKAVREYIKNTVIVKAKSDGVGINSTLRMALQKERGSELARTLFRAVPNEVMLKWTYNDVESAIRSYIRTLAPDIELKRTFGTVQIQEILEPVKKELSKKLDEMPDGPEKKKLEDENEKVYKLLEIQLQRLRGTRTVATRAAGTQFLDKFAETIMNLAIAAKLGSVLFPSTADLGKIGQVSGQKNAMVGIFRNVKSKFTEDGFDFTKATIMFGVTERMNAFTQRQMYQLYEDMVPGDGKILNFSRWAASKNIRLSLMPMLNQFMKESTVAAVMAAFNPMIKKMAEEGAEAIPKKTRDYLFKHGIDEDMAKRIMKQVYKDPETWWHVKDYDWSPNTANWDDVEARMVYHAFMAGEYNRAVVTPGLEKPAWADAGPVGKLAYQFRGYLFSSTSKLFLAGLQHPDLNLAATYAISMALGALQKFARAYIIGGDYWERVKNWSAARWIDVAIDQGAPIGILTEINRLALLSGIPYFTAEYWFDGKEPKRNMYYTREDLTKFFMGPAWPMLLYDGSKLVTKTIGALRGNDEITARDIHRLRGMLAFQNVFYLSWSYDLLEKALVNAFDIPEM